MNKQDLPIFWLKILSKVISFLSARYFCITLRILEEKSDTVLSITACTTATATRRKMHDVCCISRTPAGRETLLQTPPTAWRAGSPMSWAHPSTSRCVSGPTLHVDSPPKNNLGTWGLCITDSWQHGFPKHAQACEHMWQSPLTDQRASFQNKG